MKVWLVHNADECLIAFINSVGEVEYTTYVAVDGGTDTIPDGITIMQVVKTLADIEGIDEDVHEVKEEPC